MASSNEDMTSVAWMAEAKDDPQIEHLLNEVGRSLLGEQSDWYTDPAKLAKLADALGPQSALMFQLRQVTNRQEQVEWLAQALATTQTPGSARYSAPVYDENYQLYYRFDNEASVYEWCADPHVPSPEWMSQSAADAMVAQGVSRQAAHEPQEVAAGRNATGHDAEPTWTWDDGWGMFYRMGASGVYEYSHSVDDAHNRPDGVWLSGEQVLQQRQQAEASRVGQAERVAAPGEAAQGEHGEGGHVESRRGEEASGPVVAQPLDLESALGVFEQAGVPELREVVEDIEALFAELKEIGVA